MGESMADQVRESSPRRRFVDDSEYVGASDLSEKGVFTSGGPARWRHLYRTGATLDVVAHVLDGKAIIVAVRAQAGSTPQVVETTVTVSWSDCHYGGKRPWLLCPAWNDLVPCERRVSRLYLTPDGLMCRHCAGLGYRSDHQERRCSPISRARKILRRLGGSGALAEPFPPRPSGMHDVTYRRLHREFRELLGLPTPRLPKVVQEVWGQPGAEPSPGTAEAAFPG